MATNLKELIAELKADIAELGDEEDTFVITPSGIRSLLDALDEKDAALREFCDRLGPRWFLEQNWAAPLAALSRSTTTERE